MQGRKEKELRNLAATLQDEWANQRGEKMQALEKLHQESLRDVGQSHRSAKHNVSERRLPSLIKFDKIAPDYSSVVALKGWVVSCVCV